jgi:hypothetical protein
MKFLFSLCFFVIGSLVPAIMCAGDVTTAADARLLRTTDGFANGRFWNSMPDKDRLLFIYGLQQGISLMPDDTKLRDQLLCKATLAEITGTANRIFAEPSNASLPVTVAFKVHCLELNGGSRGDSDVFLARMRKLYSEFEAKRPP